MKVILAVQGRGKAVALAKNVSQHCLCSDFDIANKIALQLLGPADEVIVMVCIPEWRYKEPPNFGLLPDPVRSLLDMRVGHIDTQKN